MKIYAHIDKAKLKKYMDEIREQIHLSLIAQVVPHIEAFAKELIEITQPFDGDPNAYETGWFGTSWNLMYESEKRTYISHAPFDRGGTRDNYDPYEVVDMQKDKLSSFASKLTNRKMAKWLKGEAIYLFNNVPYTEEVIGLNELISMAELELALRIGK